MTKVTCSLLSGANKEGCCDLCSKPLAGRRRRWCSDKCSRFFYANHRYSDARKIAKRRDGYRCVTCGSKNTLEVNHIIPCIGRHAKSGCWHHVENLETLCRKHHLEVTAAQRAKGDFRKPKRAKRKKR